MKTKFLRKLLLALASLLLIATSTAAVAGRHNCKADEKWVQKFKLCMKKGSV